MLSLTKGVYIFDIEADNLLEEATKIHCLSIGKVLKSGELKIVSTTDYEEMKNFFLNKDITKVGHNIISYDQEVVMKILGIQPTEKKLIDTLLLSWYLYPNRNTHGLKDFGEEFGIAKPVVEDWQEQPIEVYINRCEEDVKINYHLWMEQRDYLLEIYNEESEAIKLIKYLNLKDTIYFDVNGEYTKPDSLITLISPENGRTIDQDTMLFNWKTVNNSRYYKLELATDSLFGNLIFSKNGSFS